jgi:hypothetical protein
MTVVRLGLPQEPHWITLLPGVRHFVRPASTAMTGSLRAKASRLARAMLEPENAARLAGMAEGADLTEDEIVHGFHRLFLAILTAQLATIEWEGYEDAAGKPVPVSNANIEEAFRQPLIADLWLEKYFAPYEALAEEGNGSGPPSNGISTEAPLTAKAAEPSPAA